MAVQPGQLQLGAGQYPSGDLQRLGGRHPEPRRRGAGREPRVGAGVDVRADPQQHLLPARRERGDPVDLRRRVQHDPPDARGERGLEVLVGLDGAVQHDAVPGQSRGRGHRDLAAGARVDRAALVGDQAGHSAAEERLAGVDDLGVGQRGPVGAAAGADVGGVEHLHRGAEAGGELGEVDAADLQGAVGGHAGRDRPQARLEAGGERRAEGGEQVGEGHRDDSLVAGARCGRRAPPLSPRGAARVLRRYAALTPSGAGLAAR